MSTRLLAGDCRVTLPTLEPGSAQTCITSVPYYQLRSYLAANDPLKPFEIGLEPTPELWLAHLSHAFHEVRRVLRDDGTLWVNCGDSYAGSGNGAHDYRDRASSTSLSLNPDKYKGQKPLQRVGPQEHTEGAGQVPGYKPKNLMMMPSRLAMALQADGWILRSMMPWVKRSAMPESVSDRPSTAVEYWFLFSKRPRYFWDADAVRHGVSGNAHSRGDGVNPKSRANGYAPGQETANMPQLHRSKQNTSFSSAVNELVTSRNRRNSDWFLESWQGLMLDEQDDPLALVVNPAGYSGTHFATFPPNLIEPMIKASTSEKGQCPECGAPWVRVTKRSPMVVVPSSRRAAAAAAGAGRGRTATSVTMTEAPTSQTTGWRPSCTHTDLVPVPQTVLDCFAGAGTTLMVADRLGRNAIGCELSSEYSNLAADRIVGDSPMFSDVEVA